MTQLMLWQLPFAQLITEFNMKFYCIHKKDYLPNQLLKKSCQERGIDFVSVDPDDKKQIDNLNLTKDDLLYRVITSKNGFRAEKKLIKSKVTTFYKKNPLALKNIPNTVIHCDNPKIPTPKTIFGITKDRDVLRQQVKDLGGFPIILKVLGGQHGIGVMKIDSFSSLFSVIDYLLSIKKPEDFMLRQYINTDKTARFIVVGDKVVDTLEYKARDDDFRSNEGDDPIHYEAKYPKELKDIAVEALNCLGLEFGGVDILIENGKPYLAETNFPCFFPKPQLYNNSDISGKMVDFLVAKSKSA